MDGKRFDAWTRRLVAAPTSRRRLLGGMAAGLGGWIGFGSEVGAGVCRDVGRRCRRDKDCCSRTCRAGRETSTCACVPLGKPCRREEDCCNRKAYCLDFDADGTATCCYDAPEPCTKDSDCCFGCLDGTCL